MGAAFGASSLPVRLRSDDAHRWRSGMPRKGCRSLPMGSVAGAGVDAFSCLAAAGSQEIGRLRAPDWRAGNA
jgi:hypothetical protein